MTSNQEGGQDRLLADAVLGDLRHVSWPALVELPPVRVVDAPAGGRPGTLTIYRDLVSDDAIRIVVQIARPGWLGTARITAVRCVRRANGEERMLRNYELWDFT